MKKNITAIIFLLATISIYSQKKGENVEPWFDNYERTPFQQGKEGTILLRITNKGKNVDDCIEKAKQQAVYSIIFKGYSEANNIPKADPISPDGESLYNEKIDYFKEFFTNTSLYRSYVPKTDLDLKNPASEIDRKTWEVTTIVTIEVNRLRSDLEKQKIIKSLVDFGFTPKVIVVPGDEWMKNHPQYINIIPNTNPVVKAFNYSDAILDKDISGALNSIRSKYNKPTGPFVVIDIASKKAALIKEEAKNNARAKEKQESNLDLFARVVSADLWVKVEIDDSNPGQNIVTLKGIDPYTNNEALSGTPLQKTTHSGDAFQLMMNSINGASDEMRTKIFGYFKSISEEGLGGEILISLQEGADFDFNTEIPLNDSSSPLNVRLKSIVKKYSMPDKVEESGDQTETRLLYSIKIPLFAKGVDEDGAEVVEKNGFTTMGNSLKKLLLTKYGILSIVESKGLGRIELIITGKKE
jgi:hypothetical protein